MARVLIIENGDDWRALNVPEDWDLDDVDRYLNGRAYGRAAVVSVEEASDDDFCPHGIPLEFCGNCHESDDPDDFLPVDGGEYGGGSV